MKTTELSNTSTKSDQLDKQNSGEQIIEYKNIENTPFTIVRNEKLYYGLIGNHRLTDAYDNEHELEKDLLDINWNRLTQVIWAIVEKLKTNEIKE